MNLQLLSPRLKEKSEVVDLYFSSESEVHKMDSEEESDKDIHEDI